MASSKKYSYYLRGNQIALIEEDTGLGSGTCSLSNYKNQAACENAGGTWTAASSSGSDTGKYKSPQSSITNGLEIEYTYSPTFNLQSTGDEAGDFWRFLGWGSNGTNLLLFTYGGPAQTVRDLSGQFAADDWIYVSGSGRWSGLHQVKSTGSTTGIVTLKTRCNLKPSENTIAGTFATDETFNGNNAAADADVEAFKDAQAYRDTAYVFIPDAASESNCGLFELTADTTVGEFTFANKITLDSDGDYTVSAAANAAASDTATFYNAFYEQINVYEGIEVLQDETFELDISRYQANALVYYVKAKLAEDQGDLEKYLYNKNQFRALMQRHESSRIWGSRRVFPGIGAIR